MGKNDLPLDNVRSTIPGVMNQSGFLGIVENDKIIGTTHFVFYKESVPSLMSFYDRLPEHIRHYKNLGKVIPKKRHVCEGSFIAERAFYARDEQNKDGFISDKTVYVTDEESVFNGRYWWLICKRLGFTLKPAKDVFQPRSPWAICDGSKVVGALMPVDPVVLVKDNEDNDDG